MFLALALVLGCDDPDVIDQLEADLQAAEEEEAEQQVGPSELKSAPVKPVAVSQGQVCNVYLPTPVYKYYGGSGWMYTIPDNGGFRIVATSSAWYFGHGNGGQDGWVRAEHIKSYTCHY